MDAHVPACSERLASASARTAAAVLLVDELERELAEVEATVIGAVVGELRAALVHARADAAEAFDAELRTALDEILAWAG